ncbi:hypothetical protein B0T18DRAFT_428716 [Schizothecium vesticola]|uniref:Nephrocystin 3-like N-terminal domain-containing protein n=1 Tax=Schizothecium vesticola TaxID=314040 RepID=A0AA40K4Q9_9PEZI|nr:hypothetical protein B0T18DRAFT_428716 [Schizothecium vesticola]
MVRTDEALREWDAVVRELTTSEEREAFFNEVKHVSTLSDYAQAIARHVRDTNEGSKTIRIAKWIRPVLEGLNMIAPMAMNLCPVDTRISGVVLGAIANVLAVSSKYVDYQERLERKVAEMASMLDFAAQYSDYVFPKSLSLRKALIKLYSVILRFCVDASRLFIARDGSKRAAISRVVRSSWETFETRFGDVTAEFAQRYEEFKLAIGACRDRAIAQLHHNQNAATDMLQHGLSTLERKLQEDHEREEMRRIKERTASLRQERKRLLALLPSGFSREIQEEKLINIVDGTGQWLLDSQAFQCWLTQPRSQLLWVYGKHGSGKSHVASRIINELRFQCDSERAAASCSDDLTALAYVYCSSLTEGGNNPKQLLGSILHQLFAQHPPAAKLPALPQAFHGDYDLTASGGVTISDIKSAIAALSAWFSRTLLVFDGLDECSRSEREDRAGGPRNAGKENFQRLCEFLSILPKDAAPSAAIKILVFSRPDYPEIETSFAGCARIQADGGANEDDIKKYITQTTEELGMKNSRVLGEVKSKLLSGSEGMFLWARLFIGILKDECRTAKDVQDAMKELPHSLGDVYRRSLERIVRQPPRVRTRALTAIMWVVNAKRFLSKAEMLQLLAVQPDMEDWDEDCEFEREGGLLPECGDLIQLVNDRYKLIHASLKEFLTGSLAGMQSIQEYRQIQQEQAERMAETCLVFLNLGSFKRGPTQTKSELKALVHGHPFLDYAATQWGNHLAEVEDLSERGEELYNLATRLLHSDDARELCRQLALHLSSGTDSTLVFPYFGRTTPLHLLAMFNLFRLAELLPDTVEQLDHEDMFKYTPLDDAFNHKNRQMAEWLLQKHLRHRDRNAWIVALGHLAELGEDIDRGFRGEPPLYLAATQGNVQAVNMLLSLGADINLTFEGVTPLYGAIMDGKSEAALRLIEGNADISIGAVSSNTNALHATVGSKECLELLLRSGADPATLDEDGRSAVHDAASKGYLDCIDILAAAVKGDNASAFLLTLLDFGAELLSRTSSGNTALHISSKDGNTRFAEALMNTAEAAQLVQSQNDDGETPLHLAARDGSQAVVDLLLRHEPSLRHARDKKLRMPLHRAAEGGHLNCLECLGDQESWDSPGFQSRTPLFCASSAGHLPVVRFLLQKTQMIDAEDEEGLTTLTVALAHNHIAVANELLDHHADPTAGGRLTGFTSLLFAVQSKDEEIVYALRCVADACHDQYAIFIKAIGVVMHYGEYEDFLQPLIKAYKDWDAAYNYSKQFANVCIPGQRFLNLVEETARWHDGLSENASNDGGAQISRSLDQYFAENMAEKELEYFFCRGHTYVEVPQASNLADKEQENFDADGRLTEASLRAMQRKYEQETPPFSVVRQTSGPKMEKLHFVEDEEVYRQRLVQNSRRSQRERYLYSLDFIFRSSPEVEQLMKGHSGPIFAPFTSQMEDLLLEGLCYEIAWQFSQIFLFGFVSTTLTDIMVQDDLEAERRGLAEEVTAEGEVPQDGTPIPTAQHPPSASLESRPNFLDVEDEFLDTPSLLQK